MKTLIIAVLISASAAPAFAGYVNGYFKQNGTYVAPHYRSNPDSYQDNNYSYKGNVNPYTGQIGTQSGQDAYGNDCSYSSAC